MARSDRDVVALVKRERLAERTPLNHRGVVAQLWRGGSGRQTQLAHLLAGVDVRPLDEDLGRRAGVLLGRSRSKDAVDAGLLCLAVGGDEILISDPRDLSSLAEAAGVHGDLVVV